MHKRYILARSMHRVRDERDLHAATGMLQGAVWIDAGNPCCVTMIGSVFYLLWSKNCEPSGNLGG